MDMILHQNTDKSHISVCVCAYMLVCLISLSTCAVLCVFLTPHLYTSLLSQRALHLEMEMDCPVSFLQNHCSVSYVYNLLCLCRIMYMFVHAHTPLLTESLSYFQGFQTLKET